MPFKESFDDIYKLGIKASCEETGIYCERVDEQIFHERILDRIFNQISKAELIIADMTGRNPNVFYEVGYAHALGKQAILLTQNADDIPFDLKDYPHIIYGGKITNLKQELKKRLKWFLREPKEGLVSSNFNLDFYIDGTLIDNNPTIKRMVFYNRRNPLEIKIDIFNKSELIFDEKIRIGLEFPIPSSIFSYNEIVNYRCVNLPDDKTIFISEELTNIFPSSWESIEFNLKVNKGYYNGPLNVVLKVFTKLQVFEKPFNLEIDFCEFKKLPF